MRAWLLQVGTPRPIAHTLSADRYGYLAQALVDQGHEVLRWAVKCRHGDVAGAANRNRVELDRNHTVQFVAAPSAARGFGPAALFENYLLGQRLRSQMAAEPRPDLIVAATPPLEWAAAAVDYGRSHGVPVVVDVRELWPEAFVQRLPRLARRAGRLAMRPYARLAARVCREADSLVAASQGYLDWALTFAGRGQEPHDAVMPEGFEPIAISADELAAKVAAMRERGIDPQHPSCLFAGPLERPNDLETVIDAAERLHKIGRPRLQFLLCGDGSQRAALERRADKLRLRNVHYLGDVDPATLRAAASISSIGLCPSEFDAMQGIPSQCFQYMACRLAIVSSLPGELDALIRHHGCGLTYDAGSINALTNTVNRLLLNPQTLESLRSHGYEAWSQLYRSRSVCAQFADHLGSLVRVRRQAA